MGKGLYVCKLWVCTIRVMKPTFKRPALPGREALRNTDDELETVSSTILS